MTHSGQHKASSSLFGKQLKPPSDCLQAPIGTHLNLSKDSCYLCPLSTNALYLQLDYVIVTTHLLNKPPALMHDSSSWPHLIMCSPWPCILLTLTLLPVPVQMLPTACFTCSTGFTQVLSCNPTIPAAHILKDQTGQRTPCMTQVQSTSDLAASQPYIAHLAPTVCRTKP